MSLEDTHAGKFVDQLSQLLLDEAKTGRQHIVLLGSFESVQEHYLVGLKRILVHLRDSGETRQGEEENSSSLGDRLVHVTIRFNVLVGGCSLDKGLVNGVRLALCELESLYEGLIVDKWQVALVFSQFAEECILKFSLLSLIRRCLYDQSFASSLKIRLFVANDVVQELITKTQEGNVKVDDHSLSEDFR